MRIPISEITVNPGRRELDLDDVKELADSIRDLGLLHPIIVDKKHTLIAGLHRLEAVKLLEWTEIECTVSSLEGLKAELAEIDENVIRSDLTTLEFGELLLKRKEIYETLHPETKAGISQANGMNRALGNNVECKMHTTSKPFVQDTAEKTGVNPSTIQRQVQTAKNLTPDAKKIIQESNLKIAKTTALKLSQLEPEEQTEAANMLATGQIRSVEQYRAVKSVQHNGSDPSQADRLEEELSQNETASTEPAQVSDPNLPPELPYCLPDKCFNSFEESVADLKNPDKDCSCTPDIFLAEYSGFIHKFIKDLLFIQTFSTKMVQRFKILFYPLQRRDIFSFFKQHLRHIDLKLLPRNIFFFIKLENKSKAFLRVPLSFSVASACCLYHRVHSCQLSVHRAEIQIHTCFYKTGGNKNAFLIIL